MTNTPKIPEQNGPTPEQVLAQLDTLIEALTPPVYRPVRLLAYEMLPVFLPVLRNTLHQQAAELAQLAQAGQDEERLAYHQSEMNRLDAGDRADDANFKLWQAHMNCAGALAQRIRATERLTTWEVHRAALAQAGGEG